MAIQITQIILKFQVNLLSMLTKIYFHNTNKQKKLIKLSCLKLLGLTRYYYCSAIMLDIDVIIMMMRYKNICELSNKLDSPSLYMSSTTKM